MRYILFLLSFCLLACGDSNDDTTLIGEGDDAGAATETSSQTAEAPAPKTTKPTVDDNPVARSTEFFGQGGNLYKPASDPHGSGGGNLVVLLSSKYTRQFDRCTIRTHEGTRDLACIDNQPWTQIPYSCFSNGDRQTWRADFKCGSVSSVSVTCYEAKQEITFTVPREVRGNVCQRFG